MNKDTTLRLLKSYEIEDRHIWEGWHVSDFIIDVYPFLEAEKNNILSPWSLDKRKDIFETRKNLEKYISGHQPYYKKVIPEVIEFFIKLNNLTNLK